MRLTCMRGQSPSKPNFLSLINVETLIPARHPNRAIQQLCDNMLATMSKAFDQIYSGDDEAGRRSQA